MNNPRAAKVLSLSSVITSIGVIVGFIIMFSLSLESNELTPLAIIVGLLSVLPFYWLSVLVSGFAELIEKNSNIEEMTKEQLSILKSMSANVYNIAVEKKETIKSKSKNNETEQEEKKAKKGYWLCPKCNDEINNQIDECQKCGYKKED